MEDLRLHGWITSDKMIKKTYEFISFQSAINFINHIATISERANHHPSIINTYNVVSIELSTHDRGSTVTEKDINLAHEIDIAFSTITQLNS